MFFVCFFFKQRRVCFKILRFSSRGLPHSLKRYATLLCFTVQNCIRETGKSIGHLILRDQVDYRLLFTTIAGILQTFLYKRGSFHVAHIAPPLLPLVIVLSRYSTAVRESLCCRVTPPPNMKEKLEQSLFVVCPSEKKTIIFSCTTVR